MTDYRGWHEAFTDPGLQGVIFAFLPPGFVGGRSPPLWEHPALRRTRTASDTSKGTQETKDMRDTKESQREDGGRLVRKTSSFVNLRPGNN